MWCDDFDMDLLKVIPGARELLDREAGITLYTHGRLTDGKLNHPAVWNQQRGLTTFFGFADPAKPEACITRDPIIQCTLAEALRDSWAHHYVLTIERTPVWVSQVHRDIFKTLMWHVRGWHRTNPHRLNEKEVIILESLKQACQLTAELYGEWRLAREEKPKGDTSKVETGAAPNRDREGAARGESTS